MSRDQSNGIGMDSQDCPAKDGVRTPTTDWQRWCRLCAKDDPGANINVLFKNELATGNDGGNGPTNAVGNDPGLTATIEKFFWVQITPDEELPKMLCTECFSLLTSLVNFAERVAKVQQMFWAILSARNSDNFDLQNIRLKYGIAEEDRESVLPTQTVPEVHYFEVNAKVDKLPKKSTSDPLLQCRLKKEKNADETQIESGEGGEKEPRSDAESEIIDDDDDDDDEFIPDNESGDHLSSGEEENQRILTPFSRAPPEETPVKRSIGKSLRHICRKTRKCENRKLLGLDQDVNGPKTNEDIVIFCCGKCPRKFKRQSNYHMHMKRAHSKDASAEKAQPAFICEECGVTVRTNSLLKSHLLTHTDYAPFECGVCKKHFKNQIRLKHHMEIHDPNKHICAECGMQLNTRATLNRHRLVHSDKMQHKCSYCGREFKRVKALKNHLILHTGLKPYSCDFCDRTFANGSNYRTHKKKSHPEELAAQEAAGTAGRVSKPNIPKLETLKAITKSAENLAPVVSKQSGCFAFGKKPKLPGELETEKKLPAKVNKKTAAVINSKARLSSSLGSKATTTKSENNSPAGIPTIDNIYNHIMKRASLATSDAHNSSTEPAPDNMSQPLTHSHIKLSPASSCATNENEAASSDTTHLQCQNLPQVLMHRRAQEPTVKHQLEAGTMAQPFYSTAQPHSDMPSPHNQGSHLRDDHINPSIQFYNHIRQNVQGSFI